MRPFALLIGMVLAWTGPVAAAAAQDGPRIKSITIQRDGARTSVPVPAAPDPARRPVPPKPAMPDPAPRPPLPDPVAQTQPVPEAAGALVEALFSEFDPLIAADVRAAAHRRTGAPARGVTPAQAWNDYGVAMHLFGASRVAVWAGLNAVRRGWRAAHVANLGTFLVELGRAREGLALLQQARAMGRDTPWLHEAMAAAHMGLGDAGAAKREIGEAARRAPSDTAIRVEQSVAATGKPPPPRDRGKASDLERAYAELLRHIRFVNSTLRDLARRLDEAEAAAGFGAEPDRADFIRQLAQGADGVIRRGPVLIERATTAGKPFSDRRPHWHNMALMAFVLDYGHFSRSLLASLNGMRTDWLFWSKMTALGEDQYIRRLYRDYRSISGRKVKREPIGEAMRRSLWDLKLLLLLTGRFAAYDDAKCRMGITCRDRAPTPYRPPCAQWRSQFERLEATVQLRMRRAAAEFDDAVNGILAWNRLVVLDARAYARRWLKRLYEHDQDVPLPGIGGTAEGHALTSINQLYGGLLPDEPAGFIRRQMHVFSLMRDIGFPNYFNSERRAVGSCPPPPPRGLDDMSEEELRALMAELAQQMKKDVRAEYNPTPECEFSVGEIGIKIDGTGKAELKGGQLTVDSAGNLTGEFGDISIGTSGPTGVAVEVGHSISGGEGLVGSVGVKLSGEWDLASGEWDAAAELGGKLGAGIAVPELGEAACYPGSGKVSLDARSFLAKEIVFQQVREELARR